MTHAALPHRAARPNGPDVAHPIALATSGTTGVVASGVSVGNVTSALTGVIVAVVALVTLIIGVARNNRKNHKAALAERRRLFRRGYMIRDRELAQVVSDATYWRAYALEHRKPGSPNANPPIVVPPPLPPDLIPDEDADEGNGDGL